MPDQKDVAAKLQRRIDELLKQVSVVNETNETRKRLGLEVSEGETNGGLKALRCLIQRQVRAQREAHGLSERLIKGPPEPSSPSLTEWNSDWMVHFTLYLDSMIDEIQETRGWLNWKSWKQPTEVTKNDVLNARLELIDLLHFWINAYTMLGGDEVSLLTEFHAKRDENDERQQTGY